MHQFYLFIFKAMFRHLGDHVEDERWLSQREGVGFNDRVCVSPPGAILWITLCAVFPPCLKTGGSDRSHLQDIVPLFISDSGSLHTPHNFVTLAFVATVFLSAVTPLSAAPRLRVKR